MPGGDDLDDLIDSYVADAMRATGIPADRRAKPTYAPPPPPIEEPPPREPEPEPEPPPQLAHVEPIPTRTKAPTPTGVARLAAELFDDLVDDVAPPPPPPPPPQPAGGVSIRFSQSHAIPLEPPQPPLSELYVMPLRPSPAEEPASTASASRVPDTLPGMGPPRFSSAGFSSDLPTDPDAVALGVEHDDEPTNVVTRPEP